MNSLPADSAGETPAAAGGDAAADLAVESCDPASYKPHCVGLLAKRCYKNKVYATDCGTTENPHYVAYGDARVQCLVSPDTSTCAAGLAPCKQVGGVAHALLCVEFPPGVFTSHYDRCSTGYCIPEPTAPEQGRCSGAPCTGEHRECVADELHVCEPGGLTVYDCAKLGQACVESSLGNGWAVCHQQGEQPCDPMTFVKQCSSETKGVTCGPKLGYTTHVDCAKLGQVCCFDIDVGSPGLAGNNCCDKPAP